MDRLISDSFAQLLLLEQHATLREALAAPRGLAVAREDLMIALDHAHEGTGETRAANRDFWWSYYTVSEHALAVVLQGLLLPAPSGLQRTPAWCSLKGFGRPKCSCRPRWSKTTLTVHCAQTRRAWCSKRPYFHSASRKGVGEAAVCELYFPPRDTRRRS